MKRIFCALLAGALTLGAALPVQAADAAVLRVAADAKQTAISDHLYGAFIEDISYACDGGLVSNLVNNDSFEYASAPTTGWVADGLELTTEGNLPLNKNNPTYAKVTVDGKGSLTNLGFTEIYKYKTDKYDKKKANTADMGFVADQVYDFSCYVRSGGFTGTAQVYLDCGDGKQTAVQLDLSKTGGAWNKLTVPLTASASKMVPWYFSWRVRGLYTWISSPWCPRAATVTAATAGNIPPCAVTCLQRCKICTRGLSAFPVGAWQRAVAWISCTIGKIPSAPWRSASKVRTCGRTTTAGTITTPTPWVTTSIFSCVRI